jgi:hypothetical protein
MEGEIVDLQRSLTRVLHSPVIRSSSACMIDGSLLAPGWVSVRRKYRRRLAQPLGANQQRALHAPRISDVRSWPILPIAHGQWQFERLSVIRAMRMLTRAKVKRFSFSFFRDLSPSSDPFRRDP